MQNDLISRSALMNEYRDFKDMDCPSGHTVTADYMIELVEDAPDVDAEVVRHGKWEAVENAGLEEWCAPPIRCSNCGKTMPDVGADFCPFCGQMNAEV